MCVELVRVVSLGLGVVYVDPGAQGGGGRAQVLLAVLRQHSHLLPAHSIQPFVIGPTLYTILVIGPRSTQLTQLLVIWSQASHFHSIQIFTGLGLGVRLGLRAGAGGEARAEGRGWG